MTAFAAPPAVKAPQSGGSFSYSPPGVQAPTDAFNFGDTGGGQWNTYTPGTMAPLNEGQFNNVGPVPPNALQQQQGMRDYIDRSLATGLSASAESAPAGVIGSAQMTDGEFGWDQMVADLYQKYLGRDPYPGEIEANYPATYAGGLAAVEAQMRAFTPPAPLSWNDQVAALYKTILGREPYEGEIATNYPEGFAGGIAAVEAQMRAYTPPSPPPEPPPPETPY